MSKSKFLLCAYEKYLVTEIYPFDDEDQLKQYLINELLECPPITDIEKCDVKQIMHHVNERWNVNDGDWWRLVYKLDGDKYQIIFNDE